MTPYYPFLVVLFNALWFAKYKLGKVNADGDFCKVAPFVGNDDGGVDGAGEGDVVEGVEQLGEDVSVHNRVVVQGPPPH